MRNPKKIKLLKGVHLTATEKKHIAILLDNNMDEGGTKKSIIQFIQTKTLGTEF